MPQFADDLEPVLYRAVEAGVQSVLTVGTDLASSRRCVALAGQFPKRVYAAVGLHPNYVAEGQPTDWAEIRELARHDAVLAVGETGLDFHHECTPHPQQMDSLVQHVDLALTLDKPLIIHARKADEAVLEVLSSRRGPLRGVRHCFDASAQTAARYVDLGFHVSIGGLVTRPGYKKLKAAVRSLPGDRLLLETDCPYQTPEAHRGQRNEPAFLVDTARAAAELRGESAVELARITTANARRLFAIPADSEKD